MINMIALVTLFTLTVSLCSCQGTGGYGGPALVGGTARLNSFSGGISRGINNNVLGTLRTNQVIGGYPAVRTATGNGFTVRNFGGISRPGGFVGGSQAGGNFNNVIRPGGITGGYSGSGISGLAGRVTGFNGAVRPGGIGVGYTGVSVPSFPRGVTGFNSAIRPGVIAGGYSGASGVGVSGLTGGVTGFNGVVRPGVVAGGYSGGVATGLNGVGIGRGGVSAGSFVGRPAALRPGRAVAGFQQIGRPVAIGIGGYGR